MKVIHPDTQHSDLTQERQQTDFNPYNHDSLECKGCFYGDRQYCVGICWKKVYSSVLNRKRIAENNREC